MISAGLSPGFTVPLAPVAGQPLPSAEPIVVEDVRNLPLVSVRRDSYIREGIVSMLIIPLMVRDQVNGTMVFYYRASHAFSTVEVETARALGNVAAAAVTTAELFP